MSCSGERTVRVVGICGMSASGKSTVATTIAAKFGSPVVPIGGDWYFKDSQRFEGCARTAHCWELPSSVDSALLVAEMTRLIKMLSTCSSLPQEHWLRTTKGRSKQVISEGAVLPGSGPVYVFVEGFLLFADPALVALLYAGLWLDLGFEEGARRRYRRDWGGMPGDKWYANYRDKDYRHIHDHHLEFRDQQLANIAGKLCGERLDASLPKEQVLEAALAALLAASLPDDTLAILLAPPALASASAPAMGGSASAPAGAAKSTSRNIGPASVGGYAAENPDVTPDPYDLGNVRNFERPGTSYEGGSRSDGRGATPSFPYPVQRNRSEATRGREGRRTRREDPQKRFSKALVTLLRFPNTNFTHLRCTRIGVDGSNASVSLREALELTESNVGGSRQYEELKALFDEIIADQADDKRRFRTYGHGPDTRVSATYGWWPRTPSVRLS